MANTVIGQSHSFYHFTIQNGFPSSTIYSMRQDADGFMWFSTEAGVSRFDGYSFKTFTVRDGLPYNDVWGLQEDSKKRLWVNTFGPGISYIKDLKVFKIPTKSLDGEQMKFTGFTEFENQLWVVEDKHDLYKSDYLDSNFFEEPSLITWSIVFEGRKHESLNLILDPKDEQLYVVVKFPNVIEYHKVINSELIFQYKWTIPKGLKVLAVTYSGYEYQNYYCSDQRIYQLKKGIVFNIIDLKTYFPNEIINGIPLLDRPGIVNVMNFWSSSKVVIFNFFKEKIIIDSLNVNGLKLDDVFKDTQGNFWLDSSEEGVFFLSNQARNTVNYFSDQSLNARRITSVKEDWNGYINLGLHNGEIWWFEKLKDTSTKIEVQGKIKLNRSIVDFDFDWENKRSVILGAGSTGLLILPGELEKHINASPKIMFNADWQMFEDTLLQKISNPKDLFGIAKLVPKSIHIGQSGYLIGSAKETVLLNINSTSGTFEVLNKKRTYAVIEDKQANFWLGQTEGLFLFEDEQINNLETLKESFPILNTWVNHLAEDMAGWIWVVTNGRGVYRIKNEEVAVIPELEFVEATAVYVDQHNGIWVASKSGAYYIDQNIADDQKPYQIKRFTKDLGLKSNEINSIYSDTDFVYFGTSGGLSVIPWKQVKKKTTISAKLKFTELIIDGVEYPIRNEIKLQRDQKNVEINFLFLSYESLGSIEYAYQLEGIDRNWNITYTPSMIYSYLPSGKKYSFKIKARPLNASDWSEVKTLFFDIEPPVFKKWWMFPFVSIVLSLISAILLSKVFKRKRLRLERELALQKQAMQMELKALQAQMNPHFVFNALTAIQLYITKNESKVAINYLTKFSRLIREYLESSRKKYNSIYEELEMIGLYLDLEQLRFDEQFEYETLIDPQIRTQKALIPAMLIQPFVENAVNHGLRYKSEKGHLSISVVKDKEGGLLISIEDNGVGRRAVKEIQRNATKPYQSMGEQLIDERVNLLKQVSQIDVNIDIIDQEDFGGQGTKVEIRIPILNEVN